MTTGNYIQTSEDAVATSFFGEDQSVGGRSRATGGERELLAALLSDGIEAYVSAFSEGTRMDRKERGQAAAWVETRSFSYVFSFDNVCEYLGLDAEYLRQGLKRYASAGDVASIHKVFADLGGSVSEPSPKWKRVRRPRK